MNPRTLRRVHLYLGSLFAPVLLFFATSGAWQVYRVNDAKKDGSYRPPKIIKTLSSVHKNQTLTNKEIHDRTGIKAFVFGAAALLIVTTLLGITMAYRITGSPLLVTVCLLAGIVVPIVLLYLSP
jgi:hypothetical protein